MMEMTWIFQLSSGWIFFLQLLTTELYSWLPFGAVFRVVLSALTPKIYVD